MSTQHKVGPVAVLWAMEFLGPVPAGADGVESVIRADKLRPTGERYQATVPDTLDLAERARLSVHGLTSFLNPDAGHAPYGHTYFNAREPYMSDMPGGPPNWGKIAEALIFARLMSGSDENLDVDAKTFSGMLASPWMTVNPEAPTPVSCGLQALLAVYQLDPNPALYAAWESTVRCRSDVVQVNLLLNRASAWLDVDSYLPYEGKLVVRNKTARRLTVRIPRWVEADRVQVCRNDTDVVPFWAGRYVIFDALLPREVITIRFPVQETTETYTLKWRQSEFWKEATDPGRSWPASPEPTRYTCRFRGNELVDIAPRAPGPGYPLYLRDAWKANTAPLKSVTRYVAPTTLTW